MSSETGATIRVPASAHTYGIVDPNGEVHTLTNEFTVEEAWRRVVAVNGLMAFLLSYRSKLLMAVNDDTKERESRFRRINGVLFEYDPNEEWEVTQPELLRAALLELVKQGELTTLEAEACVEAKTIPATVEYKANNTKLNVLAKRGGPAAAVISAHRRKVAKGLGKVKVKENAPATAIGQ